VHRYRNVRGRSPCPPKDRTKAVFDASDERDAATMESPPAKLIPINPMRSLGAKPLEVASHVPASSIMSVVRGVML
jgi:hypothetical protein